MAKLKVSVNKNPTKEGIKVQFVLPQTLEGDAKAQATQKLQSKLNQGLEQYNLTVSQDTDVPYSNVIGFLIPIADIKLLIKNAIGGGQAAPEEAPAPEETPAPEKPMKEIKRMQELAGLVKESYNDRPRFDLDNELYAIDNEAPEAIEKAKQIIVNGAMNVIKHVAEMFGTNTADEFYSLVKKAKNATTLEELGTIYTLMSDFLYENTDIYTNDMGVGTKDPKHHQYGDI